MSKNKPPKDKPPKLHAVKYTYANYKINYAEVDRAMDRATFNGKILNTDLYHLLGWNRDKFYKICKVNSEFSDYLAEKRVQIRYDKFSKYEKALDHLALVEYNVTAIIFGLKAMGVNDGSQPVQSEEKSTGPMLDMNDCTLEEMKTIKQIADRVKKRKEAMDNE